MKVDEEIRKRLLLNLEDSLNDITRDYRDAIDIIADVQSVEEIMMAKMDLLSACVNQMPMSTDYCYFCLLQGKGADGWYICDGCAYGELHGKCNTLSSTFSDLSDSRSDFTKLIGSYYGGETYDQSDM